VIDIRKEMSGKLFQNVFCVGQKSV